MTQFALAVNKLNNSLQVAKISKECEEYLVVIVGQKREADEYAKTVSAKREKIEEEKVACKEIADQAEEDLSVAMPALREAETVSLHNFYR